MDPPARHVESAIPARAPLPPARPPEPISVGLNAAILAVRGDEPMVAVVPARAASARATAPFPAVRSRPASTRRSRRACASGSASRPASSWGIPGRSARWLTATAPGTGRWQPIRRSFPFAIWLPSVRRNVTTRMARSGAAGMHISRGRTGAAASPVPDGVIEPRLEAWAALRPPTARPACRVSAGPKPALAHRLWPRRRGMGRGEGARALRASVRGRPRRRTAGERRRTGSAAAAEAFRIPCSAITPVCSPAPSASCGAASSASP